MSDHKNRALILHPGQTLPHPAQRAPIAGSSGAWFGSRSRILRKDVEYLELSNRQLSGRLNEANTLRALIDARIAVARGLTDLSAIREICAAHFLRGRRQRASELLVHEMQCQTAEANARAALATAQSNLDALAPPPQATDRPAKPEQGLTPSEVDELLATLPEVDEPTRKTLFELLKARLQEKKS